MPVKYHKLNTEHAVNAKYKSLKCCSTHYPHSFSEWGKQWSPGGMLAAKNFVSMHCMGSSDVLSLCRHASCGWYGSAWWSNPSSRVLANWRFATGVTVGPPRKLRELQIWRRVENSRSTRVECLSRIDWGATRKEKSCSWAEAFSLGKRCLSNAANLCGNPDKRRPLWSWSEVNQG